MSEQLTDGFAARWSRRRRGRSGAVIPVIVMLVGVAATGLGFRHYLPPVTPACPVVDASRIVPSSGVLFGVNLDWHRESLAQFGSELGHEPAVAVQFSDIPYDNATWQSSVQAADQIRSGHGIMVLTLEPHAGLDAVDDGVIGRLGDDLRSLNDSGVPVILRFAHEMNGSWYSWGQQPRKYIEVFRKVAAMVHRKAPGTAMMWAPNYGGGYPFVGGEFEAPVASREGALLDTNGDGRISRTDDPYAPYYPGDDAVDWVGISLYHWGNTRPWGDNQISEPGKFTKMLSGTYVGTAGDDRSVPDFYQVYGVEHGRPVAIVETAAIYTPGRAGEGASEMAVKSAWWKQVFAADIPQRYPQLKMVNWFEWRKFEVEINEVVDWRGPGADVTRGAFASALPSWLHYADSIRPC